jgi:asparagine N-glycosylation enzyme membrane subunit Stt3
MHYINDIPSLIMLIVLFSFIFTFILLFIMGSFKEVVYECPVCGFVTESAEELENHMGFESAKEYRSK